ncbi:MAG: hypothetical protein ACTSRP_21895 [Candidatus Helarchaeota archaeon]
MFKKIVALFDVHIPENIDLTNVLKFISDFRPNYLVLGGDLMHLNYFSKWAEMRPNDLAGDKFNQDVKITNKFLDALDKRVKSDCKKYFIIGNHEERIDRFIAKFPYLDKILNLRRELYLKDRNYKIISINQYAKIGKIYFIHGHYTNKYHANKHLSVYHKNIRYGHTHTYQVESEASPIDFHRRLAINIPCLCHINPDYLKNKPNRWVNGFYYAFVSSNGNFYEHIPIITNGKFLAGGKIYGK